MKTLTTNDIIQNARDVLSLQQHAKQTIDGVVINDLKKHITEDGMFTEVLRVYDQHVNGFPEMTIAQLNRSIMLPGVVKAWHLHFNQDEIWNVTSGSHLLLGLWDLREESPTKGVSIKIPLTSSRTVYIPRGVAHGAANIHNKAAEIIYVVSNQYNPEHPDEYRLPWDNLGADFWEAKKE